MKKLLMIGAVLLCSTALANAEDLWRQRQSLETPGIVNPSTPPSASWCTSDGYRALPAAACAKYFADTGGTVQHYAWEECAFHQGALPAWMIRFGVCQPGDGGGGSGN